MSKKKILLVDDEEELVATMVERLQLRGVAASGVTSGRAALDLLRREPFDVMVVDLKMPGMDGLLLRRRVREEFPAVRVYLATGHGGEPAYPGASPEDQQEVLLKPFDIQVLMDLIDQPDDD